MIFISYPPRSVFGVKRYGGMITGGPRGGTFVGLFTLLNVYVCVVISVCQSEGMRNSSIDK